MRLILRIDLHLISGNHLLDAYDDVHYGSQDKWLRISNSKSEYRNPKWFDFAHHPELVEGQIQNSNIKTS